MTDIKTLEPLEAIKAVKGIEDKEALKTLAKELGVNFSGNSGEEVIRNNIISKIQEDALAAEPNEELDKGFLEDETGENDIPDDEPEQEEKPAVVLDPRERRNMARKEGLKLSRVIVNCVDPGDADLESTQLGASNKYIKHFSRVIPFGKPVHLEEIILNVVRSKQFRIAKLRKNVAFGVKEYDQVNVPKYSIEILKPLTKAELEELAKKQSVE